MATADPGVGSWTPINIWAMLRALINNGCPIVSISGAPSNGASGTFNGQAGKGSVLVDYTNGVIYVNTGTLASPTWSTLFSGTGSVQYSPFVNTATFSEFAQTGVTAGATQTQAGATVLTGQMVQVSTVTTAGDGVKLPASAAGLEILVINKGANRMQVYGTGADTIDDQTNTVGVPQMAGSAVIYASAAAGNWYSEGLATGFGGPGLQTLSNMGTGVTAGTTQTQAGATALTSMINRIAVCANSGDGVRLPASAVGLAIIVINRGAQPALVYGGGTDTINGIATATGVPLGVGTEAVYICDVAGNWEVSISSLVGPNPVSLTTNGAINPHISHVYAITKAGVLADTLAAPTAGTDDGVIIEITSDTANAHTLTFPAGVLKNGGAAVTIFTFTGTTSGGGITLLAFNATWKVMASVGGAFT